MSHFLEVKQGRDEFNQHQIQRHELFYCTMNIWVALLRFSGLPSDSKSASLPLMLQPPDCIKPHTEIHLVHTDVMFFLHDPFMTCMLWCDLLAICCCCADVWKFDPVFWVALCVLHTLHFVGNVVFAGWFYVVLTVLTVDWRYTTCFWLTL